MSKRSLIIAALVIVLFIAAIVSVVYDFKPVQEPEENLEEEPFTEIENQENIVDADKAWSEKMKQGKETARLKREQEKNNTPSGNGNEQTTN